MAHRPPQAQSLHDRMVHEMANILVRDINYRDVRADDIGWSIAGRSAAPGEIAGRVPDVSAVSMLGRPLIVEVETCESISLVETREQWAAFSAYAVRQGGAFRVLVPISCVTAAQNAARAWGILVHEFWQHGDQRAA